MTRPPWSLVGRISEETAAPLRFAEVVTQQLIMDAGLAVSNSRSKQHTRC